MTAAELEKWLDSDASRSVGRKSGGSGESTGHESGRRTVARRLAQEPSREDVESSKWRYSLMNGGHDPVTGT